MSILSVDFHTHILPGIDDGCPNVVEAVQMLQMEYTQGVKKVFFTPHFHADVDYPDDFIAKRKQAFDTLVDKIETDKDYPELILGAEVRFCPGMSAWEQLNMLTLGDTGYILIEMPNAVWGEEVYAELESIYKNRNLIPILAHVERYFVPFRTHAMLRRFRALPLCLQYNCDFFIERRTRNLARKLLSKGFVDVIGSDCHSATWRAPNIQQAREEILDFVDEASVRIIERNEQMISQSRYVKE